MSTLDEVLAENYQLAAELIARENELLRESIDYFAGYVDPWEAFRGPDGALWPRIGVDEPASAASNLAFANESQLADARNACRALERANEFAINGHENRINYIVGTGHTYKVVLKKGQAAPAGLVLAAQCVLDEFLRASRWQQRQQEIVRRRDRDGEVFLRLFVGPDGLTRVRFVEPSQVYRPLERTADPAASFGIQTDPEDVETVLGYWIDGQLVDAAEVQHRKMGVDRNVKRGLPLFYPVRRNLLRAEKLLGNMATVADIQTAIAMIRRHDRVTSAQASSLRAAVASATYTGQALATGTTYFKHYPAGTILDVPKTTQYDFPAAGLDASRYVLVLQSILRAVASRLVMPEFMLTSDASNANYSSTLVAEGPAVKMFERWQADMQVDDLEVLWGVPDAAARAGKLSPDARSLVEIQVGMPRIATRDRKQEAEVNEIYHRLRIKSPQTIAAEIGADYDQEQENLRAHVSDAGNALVDGVAVSHSFPTQAASATR